MKSFLCFLCIFFALISCGVCQKSKYVDYLTKRYKDFNLFLILPVHKESKVVDVSISNTILYNNVFSLYYKLEYKSFADFYCSVLDNNRKIEYEIIIDLPHQIVNPEAKIFTDYNEKGIKGLIGRYIKKEGDHYCSVYLIGEDNKQGLIKIMFENQYYISWDDLGGCFVFAKKLKNAEE